MFSYYVRYLCGTLNYHIDTGDSKIERYWEFIESSVGHLITSAPYSPYVLAYNWRDDLNYITSRFTCRRVLGRINIYYSIPPIKVRQNLTASVSI